MVSMQLKFQKPEFDDLTSSGDVLPTNDQVTSFVFNEHHSLPIAEQRERLPIRKYRDQILYCLEKYQILILVGETGSGKSTQVPQYLYEWGWHTKGIVGVVEPRRLSAMALADRVAQERGEVVGGTVGLTARFMDRCSNNTRIKYLTANILLWELLEDPLLTRYCVIMVDEVHERNLLTDTLLGLLKKIAKKRDSLKLIISSATIDAEFFKDFFHYKTSATTTASGGEPRGSSVVLSVEGRMHPVKLYYVSQPCADYVRESVETVWKIHNKEPTGDVLAFLTDQEEVLEAVALLREFIADAGVENIQALPMYGTLSPNDQLKVFFTPAKGVRKVVFATNVAETAITIPGVVYVIDCGLMKLKWFNPVSSTDSMMTVPISKEVAVQRAGRAGRMRPGKVYRLYTEPELANLPDRIPSEMRRSELSSVVLHLKALGISNILRFNFPAPPPAKNLLAALETLNALEAIDEHGNLATPVGYTLAELPLTPMLGKMLFISGQMGCSEEILSIIAMLQVQPIFSRPLSPQAQANGRIARRHFEVAEGDLLTLLNVYTAFVANGRTKEFCGRYYLIYRNLKRAHELRAQLATLAQRKFGIALFSCKGNVEMVCRCIAAGFFQQAAYLHHSGVYRNVRNGTELNMHPLSALYTLTQPQFVIYCELLQTTKLFMKQLTVIKEEWLTEVAAHYYYKTTVRD